MSLDLCLASQLIIDDSRLTFDDHLDSILSEANKIGFLCEFQITLLGLELITT